MTRLRVLAFAATMAWSLSAAAEGPAGAATKALPSLSTIGRTAPISGQRPSFAVPVVEFAEPNGLWQQHRGIIAGKEVAPGTVLGVGIFRTEPKVRGYVGDVPHNTAPKRSKRAAIGLSMKF